MSSPHYEVADGGRRYMHTPREHTCPAPQAWLQLPQLVGSVHMLAHNEWPTHPASAVPMVGHRLSGAEQSAVHQPDEHHREQQWIPPPQLQGSFCRSGTRPSGSTQGIPGAASQISAATSCVTSSTAAS